MKPGHRLGEWRQWRGLSLRQAGALFGCSHSYLNQIELGKKTPQRSTANAIQRETADWEQGPIRSTEWDEWEQTQGDAPDAA